MYKFSHEDFFSFVDFAESLAQETKLVTPHICILQGCLKTFHKKYGLTFQLFITCICEIPTMLTGLSMLLVMSEK